MDYRQTEYEARIRFLEGLVGQFLRRLDKVEDQVGQVQQNQMMQRTPFGEGRPKTTSYTGIVTTAISAAPDSTTYGVGVATLYARDGTDMVDPDTANTVYSAFSVAIPSGTVIEVVHDDDGYK